jgi:hypothetical protein
MVFADPEHVQADLVGQLDLVDQLGEALSGTPATRVGIDVSESEYSDFHAVLL